MEYTSILITSERRQEKRIVNKLKIREKIKIQHKPKNHSPKI